LVTPEQTTPATPASSPGTTQPNQPPKPVNLAPATNQPAQSVKVPDFPSKIELGEAVDVRPLRVPFQIPAPASLSGPEFEELLAEKPRSNGFRRAALAGSGIALLAAGVGAVEFMHKPVSAHSNPPSANKTAPAVAGAGDSLDTKKLTDQSDLLDQARSFSQKRDYGKAEDIYRTILKTDPSNTEVKRLLASTLFRQEKIDESVKVLNSISEDKGSSNQVDTQQ
jgi:hypothetical protein